MRCLVLAGGLGSRLGQARSAKPLTVVGGLSLVERSIATAHGAGADAFVVVCGAHCDQLVGHLDEIARRRNLIVTPVLNPRFAEGNGLSVMAARELLDAEERFLLVMADHVLDPRLLTDLVTDPPATGEVVMAVDRAVSDPAVDPGEATRVWVWGDRVGTIGKGLQRYNGFDTGAFVCTPAVFEAVERAIGRGDTSLAGGLADLAGAGRLRAVDVTGSWWVDVDTPADRSQAAATLYRRLGKPLDGWVSAHLNRPISLHLVTPLLVRYWRGVTANRASFLALAAAVVGAVLFAAGWPVAGGVALHATSVLDGTDGEIARLKHLESGYGSYLDAVLDRLADAALLVGITVFLLGAPRVRDALGTRSQATITALGGAALVGTLLVSYTSTKALAELGHRYRGRLVAAGRGRDLRLFILFVASMLTIVDPMSLVGGLAVIAALTATIVVWRLCWSARAAAVRLPVDIGGVRAVVFDFDGTLADTMTALSERAVVLLTQAYPLSAEQARRSYLATAGMDFATQLDHIVPGGTHNRELAGRFQADKAQVLAGSHPFGDARQALSRLGALGLRTFVVSSTSEDLIASFFELTGLWPLVDHAAGWRPGSTKVDQLAAIVENEALPPDELLFVGDSRYDALVARRLGIRFAGITRWLPAQAFASEKVPVVDGLAQLADLAAAAKARAELASSCRPAVQPPKDNSGRRGDQKAWGRRRDRRSRA